MMDDLIQRTASEWARLGVMMNVEPAGRTADLEVLLLDTARAAPGNIRLFILPASWLALYGDYVAKHRLARLIRGELEEQHRPTLGMLLDWARGHGDANASRFNRAIAACGKLVDARPLSDVECQNPMLARLAEERASDLSRKWGRWMGEFELKSDALRPPEWIAENNPPLIERALTGGDLLASVIAECEAHGGVIPSESELARRCGASRPGIRDAIRRLRLAGRVRQVPNRRGSPVELHPRQVA